jgi:hypothetical protein
LGILIATGQEKTSMLEEVTRELKMPVAERRSVSQSQVRRWMENEDADTMGATYVFLSKPEHVERVVPLFSFGQIFDFMLRYYEFCLKTNPQSKWANSAYSAGADLVGWFVWMWDEDRDRKYFDAIKSWLEKLYIAGSPDVKKCIEHSIIEHLFERKSIQKFFADWREDPRLQRAYDEGLLWVKGGGKSPLMEGPGR